jgi:hypothetical protein
MEVGSGVLVSPGHLLVISAPAKEMRRASGE